MKGFRTTSLGSSMRAGNAWRCPFGPVAAALSAARTLRTAKRLQALHNRAAAARTRASGATKTVIASHDLPIFQRIGVDVPQKNRLPIVPLHPELLVEVAVVNLTTPADADRVAAHETLDSRWIERLDQKLHVLIEPIAVAQVSGEPADRKIRKRVKPVEHNSEMLLQLPFVIGLKLILAAMAKTRPPDCKQDATATLDRFRSLTSSEVATQRCCLRIHHPRVAHSHFQLSNTASKL